MNDQERISNPECLGIEFTGGKEKICENRQKITEKLVSWNSLYWTNDPLKFYGYVLGPQIYVGPSPSIQHFIPNPRKNIGIKYAQNMKIVSILLRH